MTVIQSTMHTIYHIPGHKVGCTIDFEWRKREYPPETQFEVLEVLDGVDDITAGERERDWQLKLGYKVDNVSYQQARANRQRGVEKAQRERIGIFDPAVRKISKQRSEASQRELQVGFFDPEVRAAGGRVGGVTNRLNGTGIFSPASRAKGAAATREANALQVTCPCCGKTGGQAGMNRWHFERCRSK